MGLSPTIGRDAVLVRLREPGPESDKLISTVLGLESKAWTSDFRLAESLVPMEAVYTLSHNDDRSFYWCDVSNGFHNVQGWGRTPACAIAAAGVAYLMDTEQQSSTARSRADSTGNNLH